MENDNDIQSFEVVTTSGPRKPQRQSNAFCTMPPDPVIDQPFSSNGATMNNTAHSPMSNFVTTPSSTHKLCLETSFTNLQSPVDMHHNLPPSCGPGSSKTSSITGSLFGRSQMSSSMQHYDTSSMKDDSLATTITNYNNGRSPSVPSEAATVIMTDYPPTDSLTVRKPKAVFFDMSLNYAAFSKSPSPLMAPKSILHRQQSARVIQKPSSLPLNQTRRASDSSKTADLVQDDWLGLAPLASPETLSEISSISSRTSAAMNLANSIEKYLQNLTIGENGNQELMAGIFESQLHTPKILRRAPKFTENLSTCAEDTCSVDKYKRMGQVFITSPRIFSKNSQENSSDESFESATSHFKCKTEIQRNNSTKSADQIDGNEHSNNSERLNKKLTFSDSQILDRDCISSCPKCPCQWEKSDDCCHRMDHSQCDDSTVSQSQINLTSLDTFYSANSSLDQFSSGTNCVRSQRAQPVESPLNGYVPTPTGSIRSGILESHFPVHDPIAVDNTSDEASLLSQTSPLVPQISISKSKFIQAQVQKSSSLLRKRNSMDERSFSRNESLPLLSNLSERTSSTTSSPSFVKRKSSIYPTSTTVTSSNNSSPVNRSAFISTSSKNESVV